jgi:hypothetical protein
MRDLNLIPRLRLVARATLDAAAHAALHDAIDALEHAQAENAMLRANVSTNLRRVLGALYIDPERPEFAARFHDFRRLGGP